MIMIRYIFESNAHKNIYVSLFLLAFVIVATSIYVFREIRKEK